MNERDQALVDLYELWAAASGPNAEDLSYAEPLMRDLPEGHVIVSNYTTSGTSAEKVMRRRTIGDLQRDGLVEFPYILQGKTNPIRLTDRGKMHASRLTSPSYTYLDGC